MGVSPPWWDLMLHQKTGPPWEETIIWVFLYYHQCCSPHLLSDVCCGGAEPWSGDFHCGNHMWDIQAIFLAWQSSSLCLYLHPWEWSDFLLKCSHGKLKRWAQNNDLGLGLRHHSEIKEPPAHGQSWSPRHNVGQASLNGEKRTIPSRSNHFSLVENELSLHKAQSGESSIKWLWMAGLESPPGEHLRDRMWQDGSIVVLRPFQVYVCWVLLQPHCLCLPQPHSSSLVSVQEPVVTFQWRDLTFYIIITSQSWKTVHLRISDLDPIFRFPLDSAIITSSLIYYALQDKPEHYKFLLYLRVGIHDWNRSL